MKTKKKVIAILIMLLLILVIVLSILKEFPALIGADYSFRVEGYSMFPTQRPNDLVFVKEGTKEIQIDDVICFRGWRQPGYYLVGHRVTEIQIYPCLAFKTKGDANKFSDGWILEENVIGKEILNIPFGSLITSITKNRILFLHGLIIISVLIF